jgi:hypothetical protein
MGLNPIAHLDIQRFIAIQPKSKAFKKILIAIKITFDSY